jgi:oxygen-independent coproporphyrinogen-3 oxidase
VNPSQNPGLYIHIPFCRKKCPYCGFYSIASISLVSRWLEALKKEMTHYKNRFQSFDSLYLGGGTPTLLRVKELEEILSYVFTHFDFTPDTEVTIEANPGDLTPEKTRDLKILGFNRVNVGIQSFDERELVFLGRRHTAEDAKKALKNLRACGFVNVGIDLIYGIEGQSLKGWIKTLKHALAVRPEHISSYQLTIEKGTPFWRKKQKRMMKPFSEEKERAFFMATSKILEDNGYLHYEVSNFAGKEVYYSRHNAKYWHHVPYLGLGPSAHSFQGRTRWWNFSSIRQYCTALGARKAPIEGYENLTDEQIKLECIALGLRTSDGFEAQQIDNNPSSIKALLRLQRLGFLQVKGDRIVPTTEGLLVADHLPLCFSE